METQEKGTIKEELILGCNHEDTARKKIYSLNISGEKSNLIQGICLSSRLWTRELKYP